jgi:hypothetical protein
LELLNRQFLSWDLSDLSEEEINVLLFEVERALIDNLVYFKLVITLSKRPEHLKKLLAEHVFLEKQLQNV